MQQLLKQWTDIFQTDSKMNTDTLKTDDKLTHSPPINNHKPYIYIFITMALAFVVGFFGRTFDIPAGAIIFSMINE